LADKAVLALNSVIRFEQGVVDPRLSTSHAIRRVFEREGIEFLSPRGEGEGLRLRQRTPAKKMRKAHQSLSREDPMATRKKSVQARDP
jgi:hypothetical protein